MDRIFPKNLGNKLNNPRGLIQVLSGPRQVGKTTAAHRYFKKEHTHFASADLPSPPQIDFITEQWNLARQIKNPNRTLVLDEIQKIPRWSEVVKKLHDEDKINAFELRVCLLGSSAILIDKGLAESLTGRFEVHHFPHWTFAECQKVFKTTLLEYSQIGGYPKAYDLRDDEERREQYLQHSIIEPSLGRDILSLHAVDKPALLRQLFWYVSRLPARLISYQKILDHLQGQGNSATHVHYTELLGQAFLVCPLNKFSNKSHRTKKSIPKWILPNPGLVESPTKKIGLSGFVFENLVGSHILNVLFGKTNRELQYWRERNEEIDFVLTHHNEPKLAIEVKSGNKKPPLSTALLQRANINANCPAIVVTNKNIEEFLMTEDLESMTHIR